MKEDNKQLFEDIAPTRLEFHAVRRFNRVTQAALAEKIGYSDWWIRSIERGDHGDAVPSLLIRGLADITGEPLQDNTFWKKYVKSIPAKYFHRRKANHGLYIEKSVWG